MPYLLLHLEYQPACVRVSIAVHGSVLSSFALLTTGMNSTQSPGTAHEVATSRHGPLDSPLGSRPLDVETIQMERQTRESK